MAHMCVELVLACAYCKTTHFTTTLALQKHWKQNCTEMCDSSCTCKKCSPVYCETKIEKQTCIEYLNKFTIRQETMMSFCKKNKRWLFFPLKEFYSL